MIDLTPLEVRKKKGDFRKSMRGYEQQAVDDFIDLVADRLEQLVREKVALSDRVAGIETQISDYRERERALTEALVTAQEMREEMRKQIEREVDLKRREAEADAEEIRAGAEQMREREEENIRRLRARQTQFVQSYRAFLERELAEIGVMAQTLELPEGAPAPARRRPKRSEPLPDAPRAAAPAASPPPAVQGPAAPPHVEPAPVVEAAAPSEAPKAAPAPVAAAPASSAPPKTQPAPAAPARAVAPAAPAAPRPVTPAPVVETPVPPAAFEVFNEPFVPVPTPRPEPPKPAAPKPVAARPAAPPVAEPDPEPIPMPLPVAIPEPDLEPSMPDLSAVFEAEDVRIEEEPDSGLDDALFDLAMHLPNSMGGKAADAAAQAQLNLDEHAADDEDIPELELLDEVEEPKKDEEEPDGWVSTLLEGKGD